MPVSVSLTQTEVFLSAVLLSLAFGTSEEDNLHLRMVLSCASSTVLMTSDITFLPTLRHHFCNRKERKRNIPFTRLFFPSACEKWSGNETSVIGYNATS